MPIPRCIRDLLEEPPHVCAREEDYKILDLIRSFGAKFNIPEEEVEQACNLASGLSDIIILLERPSDIHEYSLSFKDFIQQCETLKATDQFIKFASRGDRTIKNVTVLDVYSFQPNTLKKERSGLREAWMDLLEQILKLKAPKVVLCCWSGYCENDFIAEFRSRELDNWPIRKEIKREEPYGFVTSAIISFHPATVVCYGQRKTNCWLLLICHFVLAFAELAGRTHIPEWIEPICHRSKEESSLNGNYSEKDIRSRTIRILRQLMNLNVETKLGQSRQTMQLDTDEMHYLIRRYTTLTNSYATDYMALAELCMMWKHARFVTKSSVLEIFQKIASEEAWVMTGEVSPPTSGNPKVNNVGFANDDDDEEVHFAEAMSSLSIGPRGETVPELECEALAQAFISKLNIMDAKCYQHRLHLEGIVQAAFSMGHHAQTYINLQLNTLSSDSPYFAREVHRLMKESDTRTTDIDAVLRSIDEVSRRLRIVVSSVSPRTLYSMEFESMAETISKITMLEFRFSFLISGLLAQADVLRSVLPDSENGLVDYQQWRVAVGERLKFKTIVLQTVNSLCEDVASAKLKLDTSPSISCGSSQIIDSTPLSGGAGGKNGTCSAASRTIKS